MIFWLFMFLCGVFLLSAVLIDLFKYKNTLDDLGIKYLSISIITMIISLWKMFA